MRRSEQKYKHNANDPAFKAGSSHVRGLLVARGDLLAFVLPLLLIFGHGDESPASVAEAVRIGVWV